MTSNTTSFTIPPWYFDELTVVNVARITIAVIAILGHSFIIHLFVRFHQLRQTQYNHLVLMLVVSDFLLGTSLEARKKISRLGEPFEVRIFFNFMGLTS